MSGKSVQQDLFKEAPLWYEGLTARRRLFVEYYCTDRTCFLNATAAYIKSFGKAKSLSESSIQSNSSRMMRDPKIRDAIARLLRSRQNEEDRLTEYQVLDLLKTLTFYNPKEIIDEFGNLKGSMEELGPLAMCITGIKKTRNGREYRLYDRTKSLSVLCEYLDMIRTPESNTVINPVVCITDKDVEALREQEETSHVKDACTDVEAEYEVMEKE